MRHDIISSGISLDPLGLIPVRNFGVLTPKVLFRSAQPQYEYEYNWLRENLNLMHIVNLRRESRHDDRYAPLFGIKVHNFNVADHEVPTGAQVLEFGRLIIQTYSKREPLLFHCAHGHGRTSTFAVIARLAMGWDLTEALVEEKKYFHYSFKHHHQEEFLKKLSPDTFKNIVQ